MYAYIAEWLRIGRLHGAVTIHCCILAILHNLRTANLRQGNTLSIRSYRSKVCFFDITDIDNILISPHKLILSLSLY